MAARAGAKRWEMEAFWEARGLTEGEALRQWSWSFNMARDFVMRMIEQMATLLAGLLDRRRAGEVIEAREDLENLCLRSSGRTLAEIKILAPEEVAKIMDRAGALKIMRSLTVAELLLLDAQWHEADRTEEQLTPNYAHAVCLIADAMEGLGTEEQAHFRAKLANAAGKLGELVRHPYIEQRLARWTGQGDGGNLGG